MTNLIIDGSSLLWRSYHVNNIDKQDIKINAYLFIKNVKSYARQFNTKEIYIAWDKKLIENTKNFRLLETPEYKAQRDKNLAFNVFESQEIIHELTESLGCLNIYPGIMEADDVIAWLCKNLKGHTTILSSDKDMLQLINENVCVYNAQKKLLIDNNNFTKEVGIEKELFVIYKAILGDTADNLKGVRGYGLKKAKMLAEQFSKNQITSEEILSQIHKNIRLMDLNIGYVLAGESEITLYKDQLLKKHDIKCDFIRFRDLCKEYDYSSIIGEMSEWKTVFDESPLIKLLKSNSFV